MSVPPLFKFPKSSFFSIGLPRAENTFYQLSEEAIKEQIRTFTKDQNENGNSLPTLLLVRAKYNENIHNFSEVKNTIDEESFSHLYQKMIKHLDGKQIWIRNSYLVLGNENALKIRHISEYPKDDLFILKAFSSPAEDEMENFEPDWYFINTPDFFANPEDDGINNSKYCIINYERKVVLMGGGASYSEKLMQQLKVEMKLALKVEVKK
ncbi:MAG: phosphoenolpyruvate carboxykinase (ATP) [Ginsengibacter sp.]